jgi:predicted NBD/HSP70 family sugar kinase/mannose-6-phosphate isomerase class I
MNRLAIGVDIGGTHATTGIVDLDERKIIDYTIIRAYVNSSGDIPSILETWITTILQSLSKIKNKNIDGIGIAMPGFFDYANGISEILNVGKYESLFGSNIRYALAFALKDILEPQQIRFMNDAHCFLSGEVWGDVRVNQNVIGLTLGSGFGSAFFKNNRIVTSGNDVPPNGFLFNQQFRNARAEDFFNSRWFINRYSELSNEQLDDVESLAQHAMKNNIARRVFEEFALNLAEFIAIYIEKFKAQKLIIGGSISKSAFLFKDILEKELLTRNIKINIDVSTLGEYAALIGAARLIENDFYKNQYVFQKQNPFVINIENNENGKLQSTAWRKTNQFLAPVKHLSANKSVYDIYPSFSLGPGKIMQGIESLVDEIIKHDKIIIDGYIGVYWQVLADQLFKEFSKRNIRVCIFDIKSAMKTEQEIVDMTDPYMGEKKSIFGKKTDLQLIDFFEREKLDKIVPSIGFQINVILGCGAALAGWKGKLIYADLPKNELQFRMRAGSTNNIGFTHSEDPKFMYKRFYFVDWVVLNEHKRKLLPQIDLIIDAQRPDELLLIPAKEVRKALEDMGHNFFRVRPWFEPGPWGGSWIKNNINGLAQDVPNYAWSFELIVPENGLMLESDGKLLEISFDFLMYQEYEAVLGKASNRFGVEFPIRFDFLDTFDGGNLSIQCHPRPGYIKNKFGENFTQDETYYILDTKDQAKVYLGFKDGIEPEQFRKELDTSYLKSVPIDIEKYVQYHFVNKHDLLLIPNGTIHGSGVNNLVLEISSTPYIFTFKMYDWLRMDLEGKPRPINIDHAFNNLYFDRKGDQVKNNFIVKPKVIVSGKDWRILHLKTHKDHFYDVERIEFNSSIDVETENRCHVCNLVKGESIILKTKNGFTQQFNFAETFVIPAAAESYRFINKSNLEAWVVKAFIKDFE